MIDDQVVLTSNSGKQYPWFSKLRCEVKALIEDVDILDGLDCELYSHSFTVNGITSSPDRNFSLIQGICSVTSTNPHPIEDQIQLHVFDLVDLSGKIPQSVRFEMLNEVFESTKQVRNFGKAQNPTLFGRVVQVPTDKVKSEQEIFDNHNRYVEDGYEGAMIRSHDMLYKQKSRNLKLRKLKFFVDAEYPITGYELDPGVATEQFVWICETESGEGFRVKPMGTKEMKLDMYSHADDYVGKQLTVKYQELSENGVPRFPVGKSVRDE
jgi:hypothetical protein